MIDDHKKVFLLSPANINGVRAQRLLSTKSDGDMTIDEVFCFTSSLYFRGKLTYAKRFATPAEGDRSTGIFVIAPGVGLVAPDWKLDSDRIRILQQVPVDLKQPAYQKPFHDHASP